MKLNEILKDIEVKQIIGNIKNIEIENLSDNTNNVKKDTLFICVKGLRVDSHKFYLDAIKNGALAFVVEEKLNTKLPQIVVKDTRAITGKLANNFYNKPLKNIKLVSLVGTNGKTTTSYLIKDILESAGKKVGVIGTSGSVVDSMPIKTSLTTPDTLQLFEVFDKMKKQDVEVIVLELSAHAISFKKHCGFKSDITAFTNLTREHLDFFASYEDYKETKISVFNSKFTNKAVINVDDATGLILLRKADVPITTYGVKNASDVFLINLKMNLMSSNFVVNIDDEIGLINFNLPAKYNAYNALCAASVCFELGLGPNQIFKGLNNAHQVNGRFNITAVGKNNYVIIDYAHSIKALENLLKNVKSLSKSNIITVFGLPGNRDQTNRKEMGKIASKYSKKVIVTSDNPDLENPLRIMGQIAEGVECSKLIKIEDRKKAIEKALSIIKEKDVIVIAGKGDETYQIVNNVRQKYNDLLTLKQILKRQYKTNLSV